MRKLTAKNPYVYNRFTVKQYGEYNIKISCCKCSREAGWEDMREHSQKRSVNTNKLNNNLARAKAKVREYALCNPWDYWCTFTISPEKYDRYNLKAYYADFAEFLHAYKKRKPEEYKVKYLLVPEQHEDGAWHMHGFIKGISPGDLYVNSYGYHTWKQYEQKFGFISMSKIKDADKASSYILKYMTKDSEKNVTELEQHLYYCSRGLKTADVLYSGNGIFNGSWDWEHPDGYCKIKNLDLRRDEISDFLEIY